MTKAKTKNKKANPKKENILNKKVSFFTGSLVLITSFVIAASAIPSYKKENQSALEILLTTFVEDADVMQAHIEAEEFRIEIYKKKLDRAQKAKAAAESS